MVLLKNDTVVLPLDANDAVAVIGELAEKPRYQGGGSSHVTPINLPHRYRLLRVATMM